MKVYTDLNQSKKLAEILSIKSADMYYLYDEKMEMYDDYPRLITDTDELWDDDTPCWSLAALFNILPSATLDTSDDHYYRFSCQQRCTEWHDNPIDACYEIILKLHGQKLL
jgi:hypothetical protein